MNRELKTKAGQPYPLGAYWDGRGVNFALFSQNASGMDLCLFDSAQSSAESARIPMKQNSPWLWHVYAEGIGPGQLYGFRAHGAYAPEKGLRFNPAKVLLDPYAKALGRTLKWREELLDGRDTAVLAPLGAVVDPAFDWGEDRPLRIPWGKTVIYELHVKGFTRLHPEVPKELRGTYAGLACEPAIRHLKDLGVTAVELLPVQHSEAELHLAKSGRTNYWGYSPLAYFAPNPRYAASSDPLEAVREFKNMVRVLHQAGIEVILDVVYNHTCEGGGDGPILSWRGLDNSSYYRLDPSDSSRYEDFTHCGNTLNLRHPYALQMIMDSLRYWVSEMHVDGFRFDLAPVLGREEKGINLWGGFFAALHQAPVLSQVKLIAEPWDAGPGGNQQGRFPVRWREWNGVYRDEIRQFWRGDRAMAAEMATRLAGSSDIFEPSGRGPLAAVNYVTSHDGFTLQDLVSYQHKRNEANGEDNRDGETENYSFNCGIEGPSVEPSVRELRERLKRNFIAMLMVSQGVPMLRAGDELGHTQQGNNNAYCQDNEISWVSWDLSPEARRFLGFVQRMVHWRKNNPALSRSRFFQGRAPQESGEKDVMWLDAEGKEMGPWKWREASTRVWAMAVNGAAVCDADENGDLPEGFRWLAVFNNHDEEALFRFPQMGHGRWILLLDTAAEDKEKTLEFEAGQTYPIQGRSMALLRWK